MPNRSNASHDREDITKAAMTVSLQIDPTKPRTFPVYQMKSGDTRIHVFSLLGVGRLVLPAMSDTDERPYCIVARTAGQNAVTVLDKETGTTLATLAVDNAYAIFYCSGIQWLELTNVQVIP
jgi:hypothetical protein